MKLTLTISTEENPDVVGRLVNQGSPAALLEYLQVLVYNAQSQVTPFEIRMTVKQTVKVKPKPPKAESNGRSLFNWDEETAEEQSEPCIT